MHGGLNKKQITDKNGKITTVWVKTGSGESGKETHHSEAKVEGIKGQFLRAKNAYNNAENEADKKKAAEALQKFHEQLKDAGVHKEGEPFWKKDLKGKD